MRNDYLDFYGKHYISPVKQDIGNINLHYDRRKKLYRQCGIPVIAFRDADILEVGPGGGYNTLAFFHWGCKHVDLIEANQKGIEEMEGLFTKQNIPQSQYEIFSCKIEDYQVCKKYDIVVAEGFLPFLFNQQEVIEKLKLLVADNGIVVITCSDHVSCFIESMKRLLGQALSKDLQVFEEKVAYLSRLFGPQLIKMKGVSRSAEEWVQDNILNPAGNNNMALSIGEAISYFGKEYDILGTSPQMFTDYSWYKDIWYEYREDYRKQFQEKHLSLLMANMPEQVLDFKQVESLENHMECIRKLAADYKKNFKNCIIYDILRHMDEVKQEWKEMEQGFYFVFCEIIDALQCIVETGNVNMEEYPHFFAAFGRAQQYIAFTKK